MLLYHSPFNRVFNCGLCQSKEAYGCEKEADYDISFRPECICGANSECDICGGKGYFTMRRCPVNVLLLSDIRRLLPYFFEWEQSGKYPDNDGRLRQPEKMLEAFSLCNLVMLLRREKAGKSGK